VSEPPLALPRWAYLPGVTPEPDREPLDRAKALVPPAFTSGVPAEHPAFRYGLALHDAAFFWEAHEVWEAVWKAAPKNGCDRLVLRALIQLANGGLKLRMSRPQAAMRLIDEARAELAEAAGRGCASGSGGLPGAALEGLMAHVAALPNAAAAERLTGCFTS
jgi:predicted metal-dependent hydrolase